MFLGAGLFLAPASFAQLKDAAIDFSSPVVWGGGSLMLQWGAGMESIRVKGDDGMSAKSGEHFAILTVGEWAPVETETEPYLRSIVSRVVWPLGTIASGDVGKTVQFRGLFGWHGGEPARAQDLFISGHSGFFAGPSREGASPNDEFLQGLEGTQPFEFDSVGEKEWAEVSTSYTIQPGAAGKELYFMLQVQSKGEAPGLPTIATSGWKVTVSD
jgi:hypothetical protein